MRTRIFPPVSITPTGVRESGGPARSSAELSAATSSRSPPATRDSRQVTAPPERRLRSGELTLLASLATGAPISAVAHLLGVSDRTIRRRIRTVCEQIGVSTPIEAVAWAARRRLI